MTDPGAYPRRILVAVTGLSPQIVTETLFALAVQESPAWVPTEVRIITTQEGKKQAERALLSADPGWFRRLREDHRLPAIGFGSEDIHVITGAQGQSLDDILREADNTAVADFITEELRGLTADPDASLHVSIAGGRKTMGFYLGYALSLFGREQDRLSHVLVPPPFESLEDFFYPAPRTRLIRDRGGRQLDAKDARVYLGPIPFVRLRDGLPEHLLEGRARFSEVVAEAQKALPPVALHLDPATRTVTAGGATIVLKPAEFAFYLMLARRRKLRLSSAHWSDEGLQAEILDAYGMVVGRYSGDYERLERAGVSKENFNARKSRVNTALVRTLGKRLAERYLVEALEPPAGKGRSRLRPYGLQIPPEAITIAAISLRGQHTDAAGRK